MIVHRRDQHPQRARPGLRRPGRFDREIAISIPDRDGRKEILEIHSRGMPLAADVDIDSPGGDHARVRRRRPRGALPRGGHDLPAPDHAGDRLRLAAQIPYERLDDARSPRWPTSTQALREVEPSAIREVFVEIPDVRWDDVGGLNDVKEQLIESVEWPLKHAGPVRQAGVRPPKGILLSGPPGCGKTLLAKAVANQTAGQLHLGQGAGAAVEVRRRIGERASARSSARPSRPPLASSSSTRSMPWCRPAERAAADSHVTERVISQFLAEMDGVEDMNGVLVLGATNRPDMLDPALLRPGRFDIQVEIPLPDAAGRQQIFEIGLRGKPLSGDIDIAALALATEGFSGAEVPRRLHPGGMGGHSPGSGEG